AVSFE
ncbi:hypothetical protein D047_3889B, partial [Vibrio parahaemolyticus VPTS-2010_2]